MQDHPGSLVFPSVGPYSLPGAHNATATGGSNGVEAILYCMIRDDELPQPVKVQMTYWVARKFARELEKAANDAELEDDRRPKS